MLKKFIIAIIMVAMLPVVASATPITFIGTSGPLSAEAIFDTSGTNLIVTLTNNGADVLVPADILTAIFFNIAGGPVLGRTSAVLNAGSSVLFGGTDPGGVVGGEWAYEAGIAAPGGASQGIFSAGFGFNGNLTFPGNNLQGPASVDGMQYGITSGLDNPATGNAPVTGANALIQNSVVFTLSGLPIGFDPLTGVSNVSFQYGTDLATEPNVPGEGIYPPPIPEPGTLLLLGGGLIGIAGYAKIRLRRKSQ